jgi:hypothetical protein
MKNKPDPSLLGGSYLFKEIKKRTPKSRETIPLRAGDATIVSYNVEGGGAANCSAHFGCFMLTIGTVCLCITAFNKFSIFCI